MIYYAVTWNPLWVVSDRMLVGCAPAVRIIEARRLHGDKAETQGRQATKNKSNEMGFKSLCAGFETCFGWDPQHPRCLDPIKIAKSTSRIQMLLAREFD